MPKRLTVALWSNAAWMAFVWGTRIRNVTGDRTYHGAVLVATILMASAFIAAGLVLAGIAVRGRTRPLGRVEPVVIGVIAAAGVVVWIVRGVQISQDGRGAGFIGVHLTLAAISIALAVWMVRVLRAATGAGLGPSAEGSYDASRYGTTRDGHREALQARGPGSL